MVKSMEPQSPSCLPLPLRDLGPVPYALQAFVPHLLSMVDVKINDVVYERSQHRYNTWLARGELVYSAVRSVWLSPGRRYSRETYCISSLAMSKSFGRRRKRNRMGNPRARSWGECVSRRRDTARRMRQACVALRGGNGWPVREGRGEEEVEAGSENHSLDMCCVAGPEKKRARQLLRGYIRSCEPRVVFPRPEGPLCIWQQRKPEQRKERRAGGSGGVSVDEGNQSQRRWRRKEPLSE